ncbi:MAG TPA: C39 family peptidase [Oscillatoriaceae cyanobacterium]
MSILLERQNPANQMMGEILIAQQWITPSQLSKALDEQRRTNERLGGILVRLGFLSDMELNFILAEQKGNTITGDSDNVQLRLGDILRKSKRVGQRDLAIAVDEQKKTNEKLGTVLTRLGLLSQEELDACLAWQDGFKESDPLAVRLLLGEILIASKRLNRKQLADALAKQKLSKKQIGQILMECGFVNKFDLRNALKIQSKVVAASLLAMVGMMSLTGCGAPTTEQAQLGLSQYGQQVAYHTPGRASAWSQGNQTYRVQSVGNGHSVATYADGSTVIQGVPFLHQGHDNTCAQVTTSVVMNYWGDKQSYQQLVDEQNRFNLPTKYDNIVKYMTSKGLKVQAYRQGNIKFLHHLVDAGTPPIVMLEFNNDLMEQHYVVVVGYNAANHTIIIHDSIDGPYMQYDEDTFFAMWQSKDLVNLPLFGGENFQGLTIVASK